MNKKSVNVEGIETSTFSAMIDYPEKNIVFQGGGNSVCAIDKTFKNMVVKFYVEGKVSKMKISSNRSSLIVYAERNIYRFKLKSIDFHRINLKEVVQTMGLPN